MSFRQISKVLQLDAIQKLRQEGNNILRSLEERTQWLSASRDVKRHLNFAHVSFTTVDRVAKRLEQLANERKERLKQLSRLKTLEDEALSVSYLHYYFRILSICYIFKLFL